MKYDASRDLPQFAREIKELSWVKIAEIVLNRRNKKVTPDSVRMWFKRHPKIEEALRKELVGGLPTENEAVDNSIFGNGQFEKLPSIVAWITEVRAMKPLSERYVNQKIRNIRQVCLGVLDKIGIDFVAEGKYCLKHPDRLSWEDAKTFLALLREKGQDTYRFARDLKSFLTFKGITEGLRIKVGKPKGFGKYADLKVDSAIALKMLEELKTIDFEAYCVDRVMHKTGTRIAATLKSKIENIDEENLTLTVYDKGVRSKYGDEGHKWEKGLTPQLLSELKQIIGNRKHGKIFNISDDKMAELNMTLLKKYTPDIFIKYSNLKPNHFWRHQFFQEQLILNNWNYAAAGALGGATPQSVEESYGKPNPKQVKKWRKDYIYDTEEPHSQEAIVPSLESVIVE